MHELAKVAAIQSIAPIEGKDRIVLAKVENYDSIIQKDSFKVGEKVIYVFYDSILPPRPEFEFLRARCWSEKYQGFRIRPMKMGGIISEGLVLPLSLIPGCDKLSVGTVVTDRLGIRRYDPDAYAMKREVKKRWWMRYPLIRSIMKALGFGKPKAMKGYPQSIPKSDEENIEAKWDSVKDSDEIFIITEKMEGQAAMYVLDRRKKLHIYSHNWEVGSSGSWGSIASEMDMRALLVKADKVFGMRIAIEGEICGPGIQKNIYKFPSLRFFLYSAYDADSGRRLSVTELDRLSSITGLERVPFIRKGCIMETLDEMLHDAEGSSVFSPSVPREGLVWRNEDGNIHFKCKSRPYKVWFGD